MTHSFAIKTALITLFATLFWLPGHLFAAPFDGARIPADADGVGHIDMDSLRRTTLHRLASPRIMKGSHWNDMHVALRPLVRTLLGSAQSISFWITDGDDGAVLIQVPDPKKVQALIDKLPSRGQVMVAGRMARTYDLEALGDADDDDGDDDDETMAAMVGNLLILADDKKSLGKAIDAASGRVRTLASVKRIPEGAAGRGLFFFTALNEKLLDKVKDAARSQTLRVKMTALTIHVSEISAELRIRARMMMGSAQEAQQIKSMAEGVMALASMSDEAAEARVFLKGVRITANGKALEVSLSLPSATLVKMIELDD